MIHQAKMDAFNKEDKKKQLEMEETAHRSQELSYEAREITRYTIEAIAYLTLHVQTKKALTSYRNGDWLKFLFKLVDTDDRAVRFGLAQIIMNMCTSVEDLKRDYNEELEKLKQLAQKGLDQSKKQENINERAGPPEAIKVS